MMYKKHIIFLTIFVLGISGIFLLFSGRTVIPASKDDKLTVLSTFTVISDMVKEVGGDKINAVSLTKPGAEIHGYEPTPSDLVRASQADIIFDNGLNLEIWASKIYASIPSLKHVTLSENVEPIYIKEGLYKDKPNPHVWMSPKQALIYVENIRNALVELSPENSYYFNERAKNYSQKIKDLDERLKKSISNIPKEKRYLVTCEGAFSYLARDYGLTELYLWAINDESQGSPQQIAFVVDEVRKNKIPAVFCESTVEPRIQNEVAMASGAKLGGLLYVDSLSGPTGPANTYLLLLEHTVNTIVSGLNKP